MQRTLMLIWGLLSLLMVGCALPGAPQAPGEAPVTVQLAMGGYRLQALVSAYSQADVDRVELSVYRDGTPVPEATTSVAREAIASPITLKNLRMATRYEIRAAAYQGTALISVAEQSRAQFTTPARYQVGGIDAVDTAPLAVSLPLKLRDRPFAGQGSYVLAIAKNFQGKNALSQVRVRLARLGTSGETVLGERTFPLAAVDAGQTFPLGNLKLNTAYRLYADGFAADGTIVSSPGASLVDFTTPPVTDGSVEDTVPLQTLPLTR